MEGDVQDSSGKGRNGTANGDPGYVDGPAGYGKALAFDGRGANKDASPHEGGIIRSLCLPPT